MSASFEICSYFWGDQFLECLSESKWSVLISPSFMQQIDRCKVEFFFESYPNLQQNHLARATLLSAADIFSFGSFQSLTIQQVIKVIKYIKECPAIFENGYNMIG